MGKSPGKWIKTILLGKKSSRSNTSKAKYVSKPTNEQDTLVAAKEPTADLPVNPPLVSEPTPDMADRDEGNSVAEKGISSGIDCDEGSILSGNQDVDKQETLLLGAANDLERAKLEQAATKVQATFRGYLARRAFWVLRGIIRLQALVRGHLVRRQAVATLRCMQGIIKFQALVRGRRVKISDAAIEGTKKSSVRRPTDAKGLGSYEDNSSTRTVKLSSNAFVRKLLRSSPTGMPLRLQYSPEEPNSAYIWLERWTRSRFWEPLRLAKKTVDQKSHSKQGTLQNVETKPSRSRRTVRKSPVAHAENGLVHSNPDSEKPRRNFRKISVPPVDHVQEHPQSELEKVKRNLRKVSNLIIEPTDQVEVETEKPKNSVEVLNSPATNVTENGTYSSVEKTKEDVSVAVPLAVSEERVVETTAKQLVSDEPIVVLHDDHPPPEVPPLEIIGQSNGNIVSEEDVISKDDKSNHDNHRASKRRASFPAKQETPENGLQNSPKLPSYMLATESAKAKLRGQGSPRSGQDVSEKNGSARRYSLPSSTGAKLSSLSPRTQRPVQANGKATKSEKSLFASKDGNDKAIQAEWRR